MMQVTVDDAMRPAVDALCDRMGVGRDEAVREAIRLAEVATRAGAMILPPEVLPMAAQRLRMDRLTLVRTLAQLANSALDVFDGE